MYARIETIEEENLDWRMDLAAHSVKIDEEVTAEAAESYVSQGSKVFLSSRVSCNAKLNLKRKIISFSNEYAELSLLVNSFILPYVVGFVITYFLFYFYGGMSISNFIIMQSHLYMGFWSIGAYLFITAGVIWAVFAIF